MATPEHKNRVDWILETASTINPYRRQAANMKSEYYIHQMAFLASYLASLMAEDPYIAQRFKRHVKSVQDSKIANARLNSSKDA